MVSNRNRLLTIPLVQFVLLFLYAFNDYHTSIQAGFGAGLNRMSVYVLLLLIIGVQSLYLFFHFDGRITSSNKVNPILVLLLIWVFFVNLYNKRPIWILSVHLFLNSWWLFTYSFNSVYVSKNRDCFKQYLIYYILLYGIYYLINIRARSNIIALTERDIAITGYSYYAVVFLPFMFLIKKNWIKIVLIFSSIVLIISSFKRGPIIILPIMLLTYYYVNYKMGRASFSSFIRLLFVFLVCFGLFFWVNSITEGALMDRFSAEQLEQGSGRSDMWRMALQDISDRDNLTLLIGKGSGASFELLQTGAHNEWIEFLYSFGLIGVLLYAILCVRFWGVIRYAIRMKYMYAAELSMMIVFCFISGLFSGFYFQYTSFYFFSFLGIVQGINTNR